MATLTNAAQLVGRRERGKVNFPCNLLQYMSISSRVDIVCQDIGCAALSLSSYEALTASRLSCKG